ncbi:hypothetical protein CYMTET_35215 [Cymbomonas tetramitiformis]|uniref:Uncharacterized protein n=1 Tax=Cymbomonas tetramitiformis TaxID=36881 RepID=A0AAE0F9J0_9CHLO|nr:hypothetical protein CYMTET_35215 [Cymbomonas tetramitiformis]
MEVIDSDDSDGMGEIDVADSNALPVRRALGEGVRMALFGRFAALDAALISIMGVCGVSAAGSQLFDFYDGNGWLGYINFYGLLVPDSPPDGQHHDVLAPGGRLPKAQLRLSPARP